MEISEIVNTQLAFPGLVVGLVLICAVLVFVFGFKSVEDFPFDKLATVADERKPAGKKRKVKDKKAQTNGQATLVSETKQKTSENTSPKVVSTKAKPVEKSPAKDVPKTTAKQEKKQAKTEPSPAKAALKETKNIKESNKITEEGQKQGKPKDSAGKQQKDQSNKQTKSKGKENVEVKNKKNIEKSKNRSEEKPKDFDEGEWEQAFSRKDKKNRKPATSDDDNMVEKSVKAEAASPGKKKKSKPVSEPTPQAEPEVSPPPPPPAAPVVEDIPEPAPESKEKPKKEKEQKKEKPKQVEEPPVIESAASNVESEGEGKAKKKKKKPAAKENSEPATPVVEEKPATEEPVPSKPKPAEPKPVQDTQADNAPVFDELGDTWKEAKTQKKASKKKVRKAE